MINAAFGPKTWHYFRVRIFQLTTGTPGHPLRCSFLALPEFGKHPISWWECWTKTRCSWRVTKYFKTMTITPTTTPISVGAVLEDSSGFKKEPVQDQNVPRVTQFSFLWLQLITFTQTRIEDDIRTSLSSSVLTGVPHQTWMEVGRSCLPLATPWFWEKISRHEQNPCL